MAKAKTIRNTASTAAEPVSTAAEIKLVPEVKRNVTPINLEDEIRRRAYELYEERGGIPGRENDDWLVAEREVLARYGQRQSA